MSRRLQLIGLILLTIALILFLLWFFFWRNRVAPVVTAPAPITTPVFAPKVIEPPPIPPAPLPPAPPSGLQAVATTFTQRYGSFSCEANYQNLRDVLPLLTPSFAGEIQTIIDKNAPCIDFYTQTTRVITVSVKTRDDALGTATVEINTQQDIAELSPQNHRLTYRIITLEMKKIGDSWRVASAVWN
ncbi:hypothetical protein HYV73_01990 [Candidatus Uhrbacteria bacterium]|nr:hypothetical protein [Candidatus Uhrbacteria bacterium]